VKDPEERSKMELSHEKIKGIVVVYLKGSLSIATTEEFYSQVSSLLDDGEKNFVFHISSLDFIDSTGLGTLVRLTKRIKEKNGEIRLAEPQTHIKEMFELIRMDKVLPIDKTKEEALEAFE
jgi:anti-sigma B factor antagonist